MTKEDCPRRDIVHPLNSDSGNACHIVIIELTLGYYRIVEKVKEKLTINL